MSAQPMHFPADWLESRGGQSATDLDLAVLLVNSMDLLAEPVDRLRDIQWLSAALSDVGEGELAAALTESDLSRLRGLRQALRAAFEASTESDAAAAINPVLERANAVFLLVPGSGGGSRFEVGHGRTGVDALEARLPAAVAMHIARHGTATLGVCASDPCRCAFVDRTRAGTRRYCCGYCNDRAAARAYRRRRKS
jgi:predicted RNA-binding Zn ribbon-like protein